jgi:hypothetical protein
MSAKMLLDTIKTLEIQNIDDEMLEGICKSLHMIVEDNTFDEKIQRESWCMIVRITEALGKRAANTQEKCDAEWAKAMKDEAVKAAKKGKIVDRAKKLMDEIKKQEEEEEVPLGSSEDDALIRMKIRAEDDGTLSFEFRGIKWDWNHNLNTWDFTPKKN